MGFKEKSIIRFLFSTMFFVFSCLFFPSSLCMARPEWLYFEWPSQYETPEAKAAIVEVTKIYDAAAYVNPSGDRNWSYFMAQFWPPFFHNHLFFNFRINQTLLNNDIAVIAVRKNTYETVVLSAALPDRIENLKKTMDVFSQTVPAFELRPLNLNAVIENEDIDINDENIHSYIEELFYIIPLNSMRGFAYTGEDCLDDSHRMIRVVPVAGGREKTLHEYMLRSGGGPDIRKQEDGAYHVRLLTWTPKDSLVSEWDFTIDARGRITFHNIRDVAVDIRKLLWPRP